MIRIASIKFRPVGKHYDFNAQDFEFAAGDRVVVETDRGRALGTVVLPPREVSEEDAPSDLKSVLRLATDEDLALAQANSTKEDEAHRVCQQRIQERQMEMKLVKAEYLFDGSKIIFYFTADGRVDFRELVKDLAHHFHTRIEMRQIGVRDEAKLIGGIGVCGRELCCCSFLTEFSPVSVRMAKEQGLALNPNKISGQCGRLLCCLGYEFETYCALKKGMPKTGRRVVFQGQEADVVDQNVLTRKLTLRLGDGHTVEASPEEIDRAAETSGVPSSTGKPTPKKEPQQGKGGGRPRRPSPKPEGKPAPPSNQPPVETPSTQEPAAKADETDRPAAKKRSRSRSRRPRRNK
jgi:cell fate regulator YaaT (PSP1 superfamily)